MCRQAIESAYKVSMPQLQTLGETGRERERDPSIGLTIKAPKCVLGGVINMGLLLGSFVNL